MAHFYSHGPRSSGPQQPKMAAALQGLQIGTHLQSLSHGGLLPQRPRRSQRFCVASSAGEVGGDLARARLQQDESSSSNWIAALAFFLISLYYRPSACL